MALSTATFTRRLNLHGIVIALSLAGAMLAVLPIVGGVLSGITGQSGPRTAFASAPSGDYAVFVRAGETADTIFVAAADDPARPMAIGAVSHLAGFPSHGVVSPDGRRAAFVTVDAGSPATPGASLLIFDMETGELLRAAIAVDHLQDPVWTPAGDALVITRGGDAAPGPIATVRVNADGSGEVELSRHDGLGLYPVAFDPSGQLVSVLIDSRGSTLLRDGVELQTFSTNISRDWALSPDGASLAFIDTALDGGAHYDAHVVALEPGGATFSAQSFAAAGPEALGVSWDPATGQPVFGAEPTAALDAGGASAQTLAAGFDIPLGFVAGGGTMAVQHWNGSGFDNPGSASFEVVTGDTRLVLPGATGFLGWSAR